MKLNVRRTVLIGFAFFSICAFWQMYNSVIPLMLTNTFHLDETFSGMIMAADNVLALFLLPFFGSLSDRCHSRLGRRMPFILVGTALAVVGMIFLPIINNAYYADGSGALLAAFIGVLLFVLVSMGTYRSPAVALMPDCTPKPLRSPANAIINLMGAVGGIIYLGIASVLYNKGRTAGLDHVDYLPLFVIVAAIMVVSVAIVFLTVKEPKLEAEVAAYEAKHPEENLVEKDAATGKEVLPAPVRRSLGFLLASIALWFIGYNAMETWFTTYAQAEWGMALGEASRRLIVANVGAIVSYIPVAIASRVGRKRTIQGGIVLLGGGFAFCAAWTFAGMGFSPALYVVTTSWHGLGRHQRTRCPWWSRCKGSDTGAGWLMHNVSYRSLFIYATVFVAASFVTMLFVHHGDSKLVEKRGLESFDVD